MTGHDGVERASASHEVLGAEESSMVDEAERGDEDAGETPDADAIKLTLPQLSGRVQQAPLPVPMQNPTLLPLSDLEPEVFERVVAEIVSRRDNLGVQFYGRRGQKQYGLDVVEREKTRSRCLYQVKRYEQLTGETIRNSVEEYAGRPRDPGYVGTKRKFDPRRFVIVTSAQLDRETANVDAVTDLQDKYADDLEIEVWGAEALSRTLRDAPNLVYAVFGPQWAKAFCGFDPIPPNLTAPNALGLVEAPVAVLHLARLRLGPPSLWARQMVPAAS